MVEGDAIVGRLIAEARRRAPGALDRLLESYRNYLRLLARTGINDPALKGKLPGLYAVTMRSRKRPRRRSLLESWFYPMQLGQPLPTLPIWLDVDLNTDLDLEPSYEETCRFLRIS